MALGVNERVMLFSFSLNYIFAKEPSENRQFPSVADSHIFGIKHAGYWRYSCTKSRVNSQGIGNPEEKKAKGESIRKRK